MTRFVMFQTDDLKAAGTTSRLYAAPEFQNDDLLKKKIPVRVLVRVGDGDGATLQVVAATDQPAPAPVFKPQDDPSAPILLDSSATANLPNRHRPGPRPSRLLRLDSTPIRLMIRWTPKSQPMKI